MIPLLVCDRIHTVAWHTWLASILLAGICHPTLEYEKYSEKVVNI